MKKETFNLEAETFRVEASHGVPFEIRVLADDDLTWQYIGSGLWEIRWKKIGMYSPMAGKATCRLTMSRDFLLWSYNDGPMGMCNLFFERVE